MQNPCWTSIWGLCLPHHQQGMGVQSQKRLQVHIWEGNLAFVLQFQEAAVSALIVGFRKARGCRFCVCVSPFFVALVEVYLVFVFNYTLWWWKQIGFEPHAWDYSCRSRVFTVLVTWNMACRSYVKGALKLAIFQQMLLDALSPCLDRLDLGHTSPRMHWFAHPDQMP